MRRDDRKRFGEKNRVDRKMKAIERSNKKDLIKNVYSQTVYLLQVRVQNS